MFFSDNYYDIVLIPLVRVVDVVVVIFGEYYQKLNL